MMGLLTKVSAADLDVIMHQDGELREADVSTATVVHKLANIERLAGFAMVGRDDLVNAALPPRADVPVQARATEQRALVVRDNQAAPQMQADKSVWTWGSAWFAGRAPA